MNAPLILVPCGSSKQAGRWPAGQLYTGSLFNKTRTWAERMRAEHGAELAVLSALHGFLPWERPTDWYDQSLNDLKPTQREAWGIRVAAALEAERPSWILSTASGLYATGWPALLRVIGVEVRLPFGGLPMGKRMAMLSRWDASAMHLPGGAATRQWLDARMSEAG